MEPAPEGYSGKPPCLPVWKGERSAWTSAHVILHTETPRASSRRGDDRQSVLTFPGLGSQRSEGRFYRVGLARRAGAEPRRRQALESAEEVRVRRTRSMYP